MNDQLKQLALEVGGSHYPGVVKPYLEKTVQLVVEQCAKIANDPEAEQQMKQYWGIK